MPREELDVSVHLERVSVLSEDGDFDAELAPDLEADTLQRLYRTMLFGRRFDERRLELQRQGRIGTFAPAIGQEASQVGAVSALSDDDWFVPSYRDAPAAIWRGVDPVSLLLYDAGFNEGGAVPEGSKDLPIAIPVASQIPHAAGLGYAASLRETGEVVAVSFGDGATSEGDFHEALNFAAVHSCPVIFICQNNQYAISTPVEQQTRSSTIAQKAIGYGIVGVQVDGNDVLGVRLVADEAAQRAREGDGPTLIECTTYRLSVHTTADDPSVYRDENEEKEWRRRDPLTRFAGHLEAEGILDDTSLEKLDEEVGEVVEEAWKSAQEQMEDLGDPAVMFDHHYDEPPAYLQRQRQGITNKPGGG